MDEVKQITYTGYCINEHTNHLEVWIMSKFIGDADMDAVNAWGADSVAFMILQAHMGLV